MQFFWSIRQKISCKKGGKFSLKVVIWLKMCNFLGTVSFPLTWSSAYAELSFDDLAAVFGTNGRWSSAECPKTVIFFTEKNISFSWTGRLLFWRSLLKMFDDGPLFFSTLSENEEKIINFFSDLFSSNCSYGQVECNFDNRLKNILDEGREMFTYCPKEIRNFIFLKTKNFPRHVPRHT